MQTGFGDRRLHFRFPVVLEVGYHIWANQTRGERLSGRTVNMSSKGILFQTAYPVTRGSRIELEVEWPAVRQRGLDVCLNVRGRAVRIRDGCIAVRIDHAEFMRREAGSAAPDPGALPGPPGLNASDS